MGIIDDFIKFLMKSARFSDDFAEFLTKHLDATEFETLIRNGDKNALKEFQEKLVKDADDGGRSLAEINHLKGTATKSIIDGMAHNRQFSGRCLRPADRQ